MNNCYECKFRGSIPGSAHSRCNVISQTCSDKSKVSSLEFLLAFGGKSLMLGQEHIVDLDPHGVKNGWASWPLDFDPVWIRKCMFYHPKNEDIESK